jgi:hypothetical protein
LDRDADGHDAQGWGPVITEDGGTYLEGSMSGGGSPRYSKENVRIHGHSYRHARMELSTRPCGGGNRCTYRVYGWFHLVGNDELDGWRLERILWIEPDHEMKDFILEK